MTPPLDTPTAFEVKRVEHKKEGETKDGKPFTILNLGLLAPSGEKIWPAEFFGIGEPSRWPSEGSTETFVLEQPDNPEWALKAKRPRSGGGFSGGGRSPADTKAIQRQHSQEMSIRTVALIIAGEDKSRTPDTLRALIKEWTDWFEQDIAA